MFLFQALLDSELLQANVEDAIDAFYAWFRGDTEYPVINISLIEDEDALADLLVESLILEIKSLPDCEDDYVMPSDTSPYDMKCKPSDLDIDELKESISEEISNSEEAEESLQSMLDRCNF